MYKFSLTTLLLIDPRTGKGSPVCWAIHSEESSEARNIIIIFVLPLTSKSYATHTR